MNNELMEQCRKEAGRLYEMPVFDEHRFVQTTDTALAAAVVEARREAYAAALYAERSKRRELTDDMIETAGAIERRMYLQETCSDEQAEIEAEIWSKGVMSGLRQARDNGYLAPAAGLTVEEAEDCLVEHLAQYGPDWSAPARSRLRARLTAAIEAKQHLNR